MRHKNKISITKPSWKNIIIEPWPIKSTEQGMKQNRKIHYPLNHLVC